MSRGALIIIEGCDASGKSSQCAKLVSHLNNLGIKSQALCFPDRSTAIGQVINSYINQSRKLEDHAVHLLFAANHWEAVPHMKKLLQSGTTLVVDRYSYSGVAYTAAKKGLDLEWCKITEIGLPKPDLVLYLQLSTEDAAKRPGYGEEIYENKEFQSRVEDNYKLLKEPGWWIVDAGQSMEEVHKNITQLAEDAVHKAKDTCIQPLWVSKS